MRGPGGRSTTDTQGGECEGHPAPRMVTATRRKWVSLGEERIKHEIWKRWRSLQPSGGMTFNFLEKPQNLDVQLKKQLGGSGEDKKNNNKK